VDLAGTIKAAPDSKSLSRSWTWLESWRARQNICRYNAGWYFILCLWKHLFCRLFLFSQKF